MPALKPLMFVLKALLIQRSLNTPATGGLGSYALALMVISFLQVGVSVHVRSFPDSLLTIFQMNPHQLPSENITSPIENESLGHLLLSFLRFYADEFQYSTYSISCDDGLLEKESLGWYDAQHPSKLSIRCLVNKDNDVARSVGKIDQVRKLFAEAFERLNLLESATSNMLGLIVGFSRKVCLVSTIILSSKSSLNPL
jgi:non-canonical poly(A) RNA polymerase PAPD5/7